MVKWPLACVNLPPRTEEVNTRDHATYCPSLYIILSSCIVFTNHIMNCCIRSRENSFRVRISNRGQSNSTRTERWMESLSCCAPDRGIINLSVVPFVFLAQLFRLGMQIVFTGRRQLGPPFRSLTQVRATFTGDFQI